MLTPEQQKAIAADAARQRAAERAAREADERIRARAYQIVTDAVNTPGAKAPAWSEAMDLAREQLSTGEPESGSKVVRMKRPEPAAEPPQS